MNGLILLTYNMIWKSDNFFFFLNYYGLNYITYNLCNKFSTFGTSEFDCSFAKVSNEVAQLNSDDWNSLMSMY